jgi:hypothetical protein
MEKDSLCSCPLRFTKVSFSFLSIGPARLYLGNSLLVRMRCAMDNFSPSSFYLQLPGTRFALVLRIFDLYAFDHHFHFLILLDQVELQVTN